jgi:prevent-host-death family protein
MRGSTWRAQLFGVTGAGINVVGPVVRCDRCRDQRGAVVPRDGVTAGGLHEMVILSSMMTMSPRGSRWSVADAKARLSELMQQAREQPQTIERRGRPLVVVVSVEQFQGSDDSARWRAFLQASKETREAGGGKLRVPRRAARRSPFGRS